MLTPLHRFNPALGIRTRCYWSSKGSQDEESSEWLLLSLAHPLCLVQHVSIRPFRATFQRVRPDYCPTVRAPSCSAGATECLRAVHAASCTSPRTSGDAHPVAGCMCMQACCFRHGACTSHSASSFPADNL